MIPAQASTESSLPRGRPAFGACLLAIASIWLLTIVTAWAQESASSESDFTSEQVQFFETKIRPVLVRECYSCHSTQTGNAQGGLRLDTEQLCQLGGNSGPAVVPGDVEGSWLINAISYQDFAMPPNKPLPESVVADFRRWIASGAPDPRKTEIVQLNSQITAEDIRQARKTFWAYQPPSASSPPGVEDGRWISNPIDNFVLAKLEALQLKPPADAPAYVVLKRLSYDLVGLPPTTNQLARFELLWSRSPEQAIEEMVESLLDSPQFGERWGRHWLDLARYAESNGREVNTTLPHAWRYRDYVIDSFNADKPYSTFIMEQVAGDLLPAENDEQWSERLIATGFLAVGPKSLTERNRVQFMADLVDEQLDVTTRVFLGTSLACARCHDHKFDPIPQSDYYAMAGIFASMITYFGPPASEFGLVGGLQNRQKSNAIRLPINDPNPFDRAYTQEELKALASGLREAQQELFDLRMNRQTQKSQNTNDAIRALNQAQSRIEYLSGILGSVDRDGKPLSYCMGVQDGDRPGDMRVLVRGEINQPAEYAPRGFPQVLSAEGSSADLLSAPRPSIPVGASGRRELAEWIASADNPLTARVMVNRIWLHLIGQGIVSTPEDFGSSGERPSHPELLDYLALRFIHDGWSIKAMIRLIAKSHTYLMSSQIDDRAFGMDPDNRFLWRANPRRLDAEEIRDSMLALSGQLDLIRPRASEVARLGAMQVRDGNLFNPTSFSAMAGDPAMRREAFMQLRNQERGDQDRIPKQPINRSSLRTSLLNGSKRVDMVDARYRSIYLPIIRDQLPRCLEVFDFAEPTLVIGQREASNTPNQALFLLNNEFVLRQSEALASRIAREVATPSQRLEHAFRLVYGRPPSQAELEAVNLFLREFGRELRPGERGERSLAALCQALLASAEFRLID
jgi:hypothetical protein